MASKGPKIAPCTHTGIIVHKRPRTSHRAQIRRRRRVQKLKEVVAGRGTSGTEN